MKPTLLFIIILASLQFGFSQSTEKQKLQFEVELAGTLFHPFSASVKKFFKEYRFDTRREFYSSFRDNPETEILPLGLSIGMGYSFRERQRIGLHLRKSGDVQIKAIDPVHTKSKKDFIGDKTKTINTGPELTWDSRTFVISAYYEYTLGEARKHTVRLSPMLINYQYEIFLDGGLQTHDQGWIPGIGLGFGKKIGKNNRSQIRVEGQFSHRIITEPVYKEVNYTISTNSVAENILLELFTLGLYDSQNGTTTQYSAIVDLPARKLNWNVLQVSYSFQF